MPSSSNQPYRQRLDALAARLGEDVKELTAEAESLSSDPRNLPRGQRDFSDVQLQEDMSLLANEQNIHEEIRAALDRIEKGTFGTCERCGVAIPKARLDVIPYTRFCVQCAGQIA